MKMSSFAKKLVAGIVSVAMVASMAVISAVSVFAADGTFSLSVDKASAKPGEDVVATINVSELEVASADVLLKYDSSLLKFKSAVAANAVDPTVGSDFVMPNDDPATGTVRLGYMYASIAKDDAGNRIDTGNKLNGAFLKVTFTVLADAPKADTAIELVSVTSVQCPDGAGGTADKVVEVDPKASKAPLDVDGVVVAKPINLTVSPDSAKADETVSVTVNMKEITFGSLMLDVTYDTDAFDYVGQNVLIDDETEESTVAVVANAVDGKVVVSAMASPNKTINGPFVTLQFKVKANATAGAKPFSVAVTEVYQYTEAGTLENITTAVQEVTDTATVPVKIVVNPGPGSSSSETSSDETPSDLTPSGTTSGGTTSGGSGSGSGNGSTPAATGDSAPIAVIAFLSVIALAGVVVFAKKGMTE